MGAGALALPMITAGCGFLLSTLGLIIMAIFSYFLATLSLNGYLYYRNGINAATLTWHAFGAGGKITSIVVNLLLMYALIGVYITGGADLFNKTLFPLLNISIIQNHGMLIFVLLFIPIFLLGKKFIVVSNQIIFYIKLIAFGISLILGLYYINNNIFSYVANSLRYLPVAIPVLFGALGFQMVVPVVAEINQYQIKRIKLTLLAGITLPLVLYIMWIGVVFSIIPLWGGDSFSYLITNHQSVGLMIKYMINDHQQIPALMKSSLNLFSNVALLTSFLTIGISLYEYVRDSFNLKQNILGKAITLAITMLPPMWIASIKPQGFMVIFQQAMVLLVISFMLPILSCLKLYNKLNYKQPEKLLLYLMVVISVIIIVLQLLDNFGLLPNFPY